MDWRCESCILVLQVKAQPFCEVQVSTEMLPTPWELELVVPRRLFPLESV